MSNDLLAEKEKEEIPFSLKEKIESLKNALTEQNPGFASLLQQIKEITKQNPSFVYALSDEEIYTIVQGYSKYTKIELVTSKQISKKQGAAMDENSV